MYYYISLYLARIYYDGLGFIDEPHHVTTVINSFSNPIVKRMALLDISNDGQLTLIVKTKAWVEVNELEEAIKEVVAILQGNYQRLNVSRRAQSIQTLEYRAIKKKEATSLIKRHHQMKLKNYRKKIKAPYLKYFNLIRSMLKRVNGHNLIEVMPTFSTLMARNSNSTSFEEGIRFLFLNNHYTRHRLVNVDSSRTFDLKRLLNDEAIRSRIIILTERDDYVFWSTLEQLLQKKRGHCIIFKTNAPSNIKSNDFHFLIKEKTEVLQVINKNIVDDTMVELNRMIGLSQMKQTIKEILIQQYINETYHEGKEQLSNHFAFLGGPGTGKTTVARLLSGYFKKVGLLNKGHTVEVDRSQLVGEYVGKTAVKTAKVLDESKGGILFIDEAYSLYGEGKDYGKEAISTITKHIEDHRHDLVTIFAGYKVPLEQMISSNEGLKSRISHFVEFDNYTPEEMCLIFKYYCHEDGFEFETSLLEALYNYFSKLDRQSCHGRFVRQVYENIKRRYATRLYEMEDFKSVKYLKFVDFLESNETIKKLKTIGF